MKTVFKNVINKVLITAGMLFVALCINKPIPAYAAGSSNTVVLYHEHTASGSVKSGTALSDNAAYSQSGGCYTTKISDECGGSAPVYNGPCYYCSCTGGNYGCHDGIHSGDCGDMGCIFYWHHCDRCGHDYFNANGGVETCSSGSTVYNRNCGLSTNSEIAKVTFSSDGTGKLSISVTGSATVSSYCIKNSGIVLSTTSSFQTYSPGTYVAEVTCVDPKTKATRTCSVSLTTTQSEYVQDIKPTDTPTASTTCIDSNKDGYCDTCGKTMDSGVVVYTGAVRCTHTHYGTANGLSPSGCYDEPYSSYDYLGSQPNGHYYGWWRSDNDTTKGCDQCGRPYGHPADHEDHSDVYEWRTHYRCTKTTINCGTANLVKTGDTLSVSISLDPSVKCIITGYEWYFGDTNSLAGDYLGNSSTHVMKEIGDYYCFVYYNVTDAQGRVTSSSTELYYEADIFSFTNNAFYITKTSADNGYYLTLVQNPDYKDYYDSYYNVCWSYTKNGQTWDILPFKTGHEYTNSILIQNCGDYTCSLTIESRGSGLSGLFGGGGYAYGYSVTHSLNKFDAKIAANLASNIKESFTCTWDYYSLQNIYNQAEQLNITDKQNNGTTLKKTPIMVFDNNHNLKAAETATVTVKTFSGIGNNVSEIIKYDCKFALSNYVLGTCTKKGTSTVTATVTASVYFKDSSSGNTYFSYSVPVSSYSTKEVGKNIKNHDCAVKSYEWKDNNGDAISDYLYITRDCPASNGNWLITVNLWPKDTDFKDELFTISHVEQIQSTATECKTVYTTVIYEYLKGKYVTYSTTDHAKHVYSSVYTPADCINIGHYDYTCDYCGHEYSTKTSDPLGHYYVWKTTKPMTLDEDGISTGTCNRCGDITTKVIPSIHTALQQRTSFTNIPIFDPSIYEKQLNSKDPFDRTQYYWDLLKLYRNPGDNRNPWEWNSDISKFNRNPWEWNSDIGKYVWNGIDKPWEWKSAIGRYSFMTDETLWEWNSDIGKYVWNGEGDEYSFGAGVRIGNGLTPRFDGLSLSSNIGDTKPMDLSITSYEPKEEEKETFIDKLKDVIRDIMNALKNLINFFREHPILAVVSILLFVLVIAGVVLYVLVKKDRIRFKKDERNATSGTKQ